MQNKNLHLPERPDLPYQCVSVFVYVCACAHTNTHTVMISFISHNGLPAVTLSVCWLFVITEHQQLVISLQVNEL